MTIFDGVAPKPTLSPTMQGVLSVVMLIANSLVAADKCRQERVAGEAKVPSNLEEVMQQSGLKIPGLHEALVQLMGGTEEAKQAASLIVNTPDPAKLLRQFAEQFGCPASADEKPPASQARPAGPATAMAQMSSSPTTDTAPAKFRPEFTREGREAAKAAERAAFGPPPAFRADFTREGREQVKAAETSASASVPPIVAVRPAVEPVGSALATVVERRLGSLRRQMKMHQVELDARLKRAETELAALREELRTLLAAASGTAEPARTAESAEAPAVTQAPVPNSPGRPPTASIVPAEESAAETSTHETPLTAEEAALGTTARDETLPPANEREVVRAVELIEEFAGDVEALHHDNVARIVAVEDEVRVMRDLLRREREARGVASHG